MWMTCGGGPVSGLGKDPWGPTMLCALTSPGARETSNPQEKAQGCLQKTRLNNLLGPAAVFTSTFSEAKSSPAQLSVPFILCQRLRLCG